MTSLWQRVAKRLRGKRPRLEVSAAGFSLVMHGQHQSGPWPWQAIDLVDAFKRDMLTTDCLCLHIQGHGLSLEIDEDMDGFAPWLDRLETQLGISPEWRASVLFPPFETRATALFRRPDTPAKALDTPQC